MLKETQTTNVVKEMSLVEIHSLASRGCCTLYPPLPVMLIFCSKELNALNISLFCQWSKLCIDIVCTALEL